MKFTKTKKFYKILASILIIFVSLNLSKAQSWTGSSFSSTYTSSDTIFQYGELLAPDGLGNLFVSGTSKCPYPQFNCASIRKTSSTGLMKEIFFYDTENHDDFIISDLKIYNNSLYVVVGAKYHYPPQDHDLFVYKYDLNLNLQWQTIYNGVGDLEDYGSKIIKGNASSLLVLGQSADSICVLKLNATSGNIIKKKNFKNSSLEISNTGNDIRYINNAIYVAGVANIGPTIGSTMLLKMDNDLNLTFSRITQASYPGAAIQLDEIERLQVDATGNCFIAGTVYTNTIPVRARPYLLKYNSLGVLQFVKRYSYNDNRCFDFFLDATGKPIMYTDKNRYLRINKTTGNATLAITPVSSLNFAVADVAKASNDYLYAFGDISFVGVDGLGNPFTHRGVQISEISPTGITRLIYQEVYTYPSRADLIWKSKKIFLRNTNQIYFSIDVDEIMFAPYEFSVRYGLKQYTPARLPFESMENAESTLNVYPNPAQSFINVALPTNITQGTIQIFDLQGKLMLTKSIDDTFQNEIIIDNLHTGTYFIKLINNEMVLTDKFVKL